MSSRVAIISNVRIAYLFRRRRPAKSCNSQIGARLKRARPAGTTTEAPVVAIGSDWPIGQFGNKWKRREKRSRDTYSVYITVSLHDRPWRRRELTRDDRSSYTRSREFGTGIAEVVMSNTIDVRACVNTTTRATHLRSYNGAARSSRCSPTDRRHIFPSGCRTQTTKRYRAKTMCFQRARHNVLSAIVYKLAYVCVCVFVYGQRTGCAKRWIRKRQYQGA